MIPETKRAQIIEALKANPNAAAVARQVGDISRRAVSYIAKSAEIDLGRSGPKKISAEKGALILEALKLNPNASAIAREFGGMSYKTVTRLAEKANIKLGPKMQTSALKHKIKRKPRTGRSVDISKRPGDTAPSPHGPAQDPQ